MDRWSRSASGACRRFFVLLLVVGVHLLLLLLFAHVAIKSHRRTVDDTPSRSVLVLMAPPRSQQPVQIISQAPRLISRAPETENMAVPAEPRTIEDAPDPIDWRAAGERAARTAVAESAQSTVRQFGQPRPKPPERDAAKYEFEWSPEPQTTGFAGPFPYVRLGKRCIVVLAIFSCAIGDLPEPNGQLFEHMGDPNAPRSSVPDLPQ